MLTNLFLFLLMLGSITTSCYPAASFRSSIVVVVALDVEVWRVAQLTMSNRWISLAVNGLP
jgi:hypothetical protein